MAKDRNKRSSEVPLWEWIFATVGFVLVSATIGFIGYQALAGNGSPPDIRVRVESVVAFDQGFLVTVAAQNRGDRTAADVAVEGELRKGAASVEKSEATFQYIPARSVRRGGLFFTHDPRSLELTLRARGYENP